MDIHSINEIVCSLACCFGLFLPLRPGSNGYSSRTWQFTNWVYFDLGEWFWVSSIPSTMHWCFMSAYVQCHQQFPHTAVYSVYGNQKCDGSWESKWTCDNWYAVEIACLIMISKLTQGLFITCSAKQNERTYIASTSLPLTFTMVT